VTWTVGALTKGKVGRSQQLTSTLTFHSAVCLESILRVNYLNRDANTIRNLTADGEALQASLDAAVLRAFPDAQGAVEQGAFAATTFEFPIDVLAFNNATGTLISRGSSAELCSSDWTSISGTATHLINAMNYSMRLYKYPNDEPDAGLALIRPWEKYDFVTLGYDRITASTKLKMNTTYFGATFYRPKVVIKPVAFVNGE